MFIQNPDQKKTRYQRQLINLIPFAVHTFAAAAQFT